MGYAIEQQLRTIARTQPVNSAAAGNHHEPCQRLRLLFAVIIRFTPDL
jgi:hypothetical protein